MKETYAASFYESHAEASLRSARQVLGRVFGLLGIPAGVVDLGCGTGAWLRAAQEHGATAILGVDGDWVPREQLLIPGDRFLAADLAAPDRAAIAARLPLPAGLAMSLEVAEHLHPHQAPGLVGLLAGLADAVLFSAAIPHQGGEHHVNEQWPDYWAGLFAAEGFRCFDLLRPALWLQPEVDWWYAQNLLLFARVGSAAEAALLHHGAPGSPMRLVHPQPWSGLAGQPARPADPMPLGLPFAQDAVPAPGGPLALPGGGTVTVTNPNPWTHAKASGMQLHPNSPWEPALRLVYAGLPPLRTGRRLFQATLMTAPAAPRWCCGSAW
ncbi:methyltransferase domain-containing protein [Dankookia sp. P2]|uniref:class I SAM-dependent methyltransferase n=1 Tax=Dankookia sp. P2 TaxID=3423955 RepID=UPI003D6794BB